MRPNVFDSAMMSANCLLLLIAKVVSFSQRGCWIWGGNHRLAAPNRKRETHASPLWVRVSHLSKIAHFRLLFLWSNYFLLLSMVVVIQFFWRMRWWSRFYFPIGLIAAMMASHYVLALSDLSLLSHRHSLSFHRFYAALGVGFSWLCLEPWKGRKRKENERKMWGKI